MGRQRLAPAWLRQPRYSTFDRLLSQIVVGHTLHAGACYRLLQYLGPILQHNFACKIRILLIKRRALLSVATTNIHEDVCLRACRLRVVAVEGDHAKPGGQSRKLSLHEAMKCTGLDRVALQPGVEVYIALLADLERGASVVRIANGLVEREEGREAVVVAATR